MRPERRRYGEAPPDRRILVAMLWRGARRRCPRCGRRGLFERWLVLRPTCPGCGLRFRREQGFGLGGVTFTIVFTCLTFGALLLAVAAATAPEVPVVPLLAVCSVIAVVEPLVTYPSWTLVWAAVDLAMRPLGFEELAAADIELLTGEAETGRPGEPGAGGRPGPPAG
ncbi:MAG: DUF983 domain-containing protein [Acidimicrobiales bacterium]|nr:DUF983 domain-containing protein [Acidimicrobiales bacterium]